MHHPVTLSRRHVLGLAIAAPAWTLAGCARFGDIEPPRVALADVRPLGGGLFAQNIRMDLRITNPNDVDLEVDGLRADLNVNGQPFAQGVSDTRVTIPRLNSARVPVTATVSTFDLARQVFNLGGASELTYELNGTLFLAMLGRRRVDFSRSGTFDLRPQSGGQGNYLVPLGPANE